MLQLDWNATIANIRETVPPTQFQNWIKPVELLRADLNAVVLGVPSRFHEEWLRSHYQQQIESAIHAQCGSQVQLEFEVLVQSNQLAAESVTTGTEELVSVQEPLNQAHQDRVLTELAEPAPWLAKSTVKDVTQETERAHSPAPQLPAFHHPFFPMKFNHVAHHCGTLILQGDSPQLNPLFVQAPIGMGKTHLLSWIGASLHDQNPSLRIKYMTAESFVHEYVRHLKTNELFQFKHRLTSETDVLLFDDIHQLSGKQKIQESLLHIYNEILQRNGKLIFASSVAPQKLEGFIEPLRSRLQSGVLAEFQPLLFEERVSLLKAVAAHQGIPAEELSLRNLAGRGQRDLRELLGTLVRAHVQAQLENRALGVDFFPEEIMPAENKPNPISLSEIISLVEHNYGISRDELCSKSRKGNTTWARQVAMYLARTFTLLPLEEIGRIFGRDHATVIHGYHKVSEAMNEQPARKLELEFLRRKLEGRTATP